MSKGRYYAAHAAAFRADLGAAVPKDLVRDWHRRAPARHFAVAVRQFVLLGLVTCGPGAPDAPRPSGFRWPSCRASRSSTSRCCCTRWCTTPCSPAGARRCERLLGYALRRPERHLRVAVHALAPRPSRRTRLVRGRSQAAPPVAEDQRPVVQAALLHAGAVPDLLPGGAAGDGELRRRRCGARSPGSAGCRSRRTCWRSASIAWAFGRRAPPRAPTSCRCSSCSRLRSR